MARDWSEYEWGDDEHKKAAELDAERELKLVGVVEHLSETKDGQVFLRYLMEIGGTFMPNCVYEEHGAAFLEGRRWVGLKLLNLCAKAKCVQTLFEEELDG